VGGASEGRGRVAGGLPSRSIIFNIIITTIVVILHAYENAKKDGEGKAERREYFLLDH